MSWSEIKHFKPEEFDQHGAPGTGEAHMDIGFICKLDKTRELLGSPMQVTSGYRSIAYDAEICQKAGKPIIPNNAHTTGHAADIACSSSRARFFLIKAAIESGINRIGGDAAHIHLDDDPHLAPDVFFFE